MVYSQQYCFIIAIEKLFVKHLSNNNVGNDFVVNILLAGFLINGIAYGGLNRRISNLKFQQISTRIFNSPIVQQAGADFVRPLPTQDIAFP
jgi:hypothetical protein